VATDGIGNGNAASNLFTIQTTGPANEFEKHKDAIEQTITGEAMRALRSNLSSDQGMMRKSRDRFIIGQKNSGEERDVAFDVTGSAELQHNRLSSKGSFFGQKYSKTGSSGTWRRVTFGSYDIQTDNDRSVSGFLNGRMAFETELSSQMLLGYFVGGQIGRTAIEGEFTGNQTSLGLSLGGYLVRSVGENLYLDAWASYGLQRHDLEMGNGVLDLGSKYSTPRSTFGANLTGVYEGNGFDIWPSLSLSYGKTQIGQVGFTGTAHGLSDDSLSLNAGSVSLASLSFTPEIRVPLATQQDAEYSSLVSFAPRYSCEETMLSTASRECGWGYALSINTEFDDGLTTLIVQIEKDQFTSSTHKSYQLKFEHRF